MKALEDVHKRYMEQSEWTKDLRQFVLGNIGANDNQRVLEVGCGTGAILSQFEGEKSLIGLDIDYTAIAYSKQRLGEPRLVNGDGHWLPFKKHHFELSYCHFLLLWVKEADAVLAEMKRVTRNGGWVLAFAEPDYGGRIDYPKSLAELGTLQEEALQAQGASTRIGRELAFLFRETGLTNIQVGIMGLQKIIAESNNEHREQAQMSKDIQHMIAKEKLRSLQEIENQAIQSGARINYVPTFYAFGQNE